jgi:hypothetical protein
MSGKHYQSKLGGVIGGLGLIQFKCLVLEQLFLIFIHHVIPLLLAKNGPGQMPSASSINCPCEGKVKPVLHD